MDVGFVLERACWGSIASAAGVSQSPVPSADPPATRIPLALLWKDTCRLVELFCVDWCDCGGCGTRLSPHIVQIVG